jgi:hypothetical protein
MPILVIAAIVLFFRGLIWLCGRFPKTMLIQWRPIWATFCWVCARTQISAMQ